MFIFRLYRTISALFAFFLYIAHDVPEKVPGAVFLHSPWQTLLNRVNSKIEI